MRSRFLFCALTVAAFVATAGCESGTKIKSVEPNFGNVAGNDTVVIVGTGFRNGMQVHFGKREAKNVVIEGPTRIQVTSPSGVEGKVDITLTRDDGKTFVLRDGFSYRREGATGK
jgi:hypothetical protein